MEKASVLCIVPYEGMGTAISELTAARSDLEVTIRVGDLEEGVRIAREVRQDRYDIILSRGGTAEMIRGATDLPVVEITFSVYDILRSIRLAQNYSDRYAIVGFPSITTSAHLLCNLLKYNIDIITIRSVGEVHRTLEDLKRQNYRMVVSDMITNTVAVQTGLNSILITSGNESISGALDEAVRLSRSLLRFREHNRLLLRLLKESDSKAAVYDSDGVLKLSTLEDTQRHKKLFPLMENEISLLPTDESHVTLKKSGGSLFTIKGRRIKIANNMYSAFIITEQQEILSNDSIQTLSVQEAEERYLGSMAGISIPPPEIQDAIEAYNKTSHPVLIMGEEGTGKEQIAALLYTGGNMRNSPCAVIDCARINSREWNHLLGHHSSVLHGDKQIIFFKNIHDLKENLFYDLVNLIEDTGADRRNRFIFSYTISENAGIELKAVKRLVNQLSCLCLTLPPLRERTAEISNLASLYINAINTQYRSEVIGFEPDAFQLIRTYGWPNNFPQFKRVLTELVLMSKMPYITAAQVESVLRTEKPSLSIKKSGENAADLNRPLNEIVEDIINAVIREENNNRSRAAKRLGISRSTLWRIESRSNTPS